MLAAFSNNLGSFIAAVLIKTLSAPAFKTSLISSRFLNPPPAINGI